ncbi:hypothetical protein SLE2022_295780 [Rubroshorea leprosula]
MDPVFSISIDPTPTFPPPTFFPVIPTTTTAYAVNPAPTAYPINPTPTAYVANPTPTLPPTFNHPSYSEMIFEAIGALKERDGSSRRAIAKYIDGAYKNLPPTHSALLTHHLKRLKKHGQLVMVKKSYKLSRSENNLADASAPDAVLAPAPAAALAGAKRGRGRPPKPNPTLTLAVEPISQAGVVGSGLAGADGSNVQLQSAPAVVKRTPGRPRKNGSVAAAAEGGFNKGLGRPPKGAAKKKAGRPRKATAMGVSTAVSVNGVKKGPGRPAKAKAQSSVELQAQPIVVPYANDASGAVDVPDMPRPRGRPPKAAVLSASVGGAVTGKRRGRPPKVAGVSKPMKPKKSTGRPVGRPKKIIGGPAQQAALAVAYGDLQRKLEFFQSKVKQAVGVLKPQFTSESNVSTVGAIQELEGLAAMDISVSFREEAKPHSLQS